MLVVGVMQGDNRVIRELPDVAFTLSEMGRYYRAAFVLRD